MTDQPDAVAAAASDATASPPTAPPPTADVPIEVLHRRAPRYGRFVLTGLLLGGVASFAIAIATRGWSALTTSNTFWLLLMVLGVLGMLLGALVAYLVDRRSIAAIEAEAAAARAEAATPRVTAPETTTPEAAS